MKKKVLLAILVVLILSTVLYFYFENKSSNIPLEQEEDMFMKYSPDYEREDTLATDTELEEFIKDLDAKSIKTQYIAINRLIESYNTELKPEALKKIKPFLNSNNEKLKESAQLALSILEGSMDSEYIHKMYDNSYIFTYFNNYSDYGTSGTIFLIKDNKLSIFYILKTPNIFLQKIKISDDKKQLAIYTKSNKSDFLEIHNISPNTISPNLTEETREKYHYDNGLKYIKRDDLETYSSIESFNWFSNDELNFEILLRISEENIFDDTSDVKKIIVNYNTLTKKLSFI